MCVNECVHTLTCIHSDKPHTPHGLCDVSLMQEIAEAKSNGQTDPRPFISDLHALLKTPMKPVTAPVCSLSGSEEGSQDLTGSRSKESEGPGSGSVGEEGGQAEKEPSCSEDDSSSSSSSPEMDGSDQEQEEYADQLLQMDIPPENLPLLIARVMYRGEDDMVTQA